MTPEQRKQLIETLLSGNDVAPEWARIMFPSEKREYELVYHGKDREEDIIANTLAVPLQPVRTFNKNGVEWHNKLIFGDNLQAMKTLLEMKRRGELCNADGTPGVRMIYIDPPFATQREFSGSQEQKAYQDRISSRPLADSSYHFDLHNLDYTRKEEVSDHPQSGEYQIFNKGYVVLPSQVVDQAVTVGLVDALTGMPSNFNATIRQKTFSVEEVADELYQRLKGFDVETADAEDPIDRTHYAKRFPREKCATIVAESLKQAGITDARITDDNKQKFLQAIGPLHRKGAKRVVYVLSADALVTINTATRQAESCSAAELRRGSKSVFYTEGCLAMLADEQQEFFAEVADSDGDFAGSQIEIANPADFKTPMNLAIADAMPERKFMRELTNRRNSKHLDAWLKNAAMNFYSLEYAWKKGEHPKRGEFNPDFFIMQGEQIFVTEIKDDGEISDPSPENVKKHEYARAHFERLNDWLEKDALLVRYQFNMVSPRDFNSFFQKLREMDLVGFRSELDVTMINAGTKAA